MVGNAAAFEVFRVMTGALPADTAASVVLLDLDTLEATRERVLPHPECPICAISSPALPDQAAAPMTDEEVYQRCEILVSPRAGVFTMFTDDPLEQAPLKTARLKLPGPRGPREITAFDVHTVMGARLTAYRVAVRDYLGRIGQVEGAVLATAAELTTTGRTPVPWTALDTATGAVPYTPDQRLRWLPARVLGEAGETVWVPAAVALPFSADGREGLGERTVAGGAVGASLDEVIANGLASALAYRGLVEAIRGQSGLAPLPEADLTTDQDTAMVLRTAHRFGRKPQLFTLTGAAPAHAVLAVLDGDEEDKRPAWTIGVGSSARQARLTALRDLVGLAQVHRFEGIDADLGDPLLSDFDPRTALLAADPAADAPADAEPDTEDMVSSLAARGLAALLVEHTTRDILATQALRGGVVLLWQRPAAS